MHVMVLVFCNEGKLLLDSSLIFVMLQALPPSRPPSLLRNELNVFGVRRSIWSHLFHEFALHFPAASGSRHGELAGEFGFEVVEGQASARVVGLDDGEEAW
jgi:hypothetical protein